MSKNNAYDVAFIGAGPAAIYGAYELVKQCSDKIRILILEQGADIYHRQCPITENKVEQCVSCPTCSIMRGFGGAGAFSDGKYNLTTKFGGWLNEYLPDQEVMRLIQYVDDINVALGAPGHVYTTAHSDLKRKALTHDLHLLEGAVRHLGTENNMQILRKLYELLSGSVEMRFHSKVAAINKTADGFELTVEHKGHTEYVQCQYLIGAPGRAGAEWFSEECKRLGLSLINNQVDVGVRVELPAEIFAHITDEVYEAKLVYRTKVYGDLVRTFCMNPHGYVVAENTDGITTVNGHSYSDPSLKSENTNFALLVSKHFTEPFNEPHQYGKRIASFSNMLSGGVLVQRFGDLIRGRRTKEHTLKESFTKPTLHATPGDLSLVLPKRFLDNIIEMIYALDKIAPGTANYDTLLYGVEVKFYSARLKLDKNLETEIKNMFAIGDGAGVTRGLSQASASGVHVARVIANRLEKRLGEI